MWMDPTSSWHTILEHQYQMQGGTLHVIFRLKSPLMMWRYLTSWNENLSAEDNFSVLLKHTLTEGSWGIQPMTLLTDLKCSCKNDPQTTVFYLCSLPWWTSAGLNPRCVCLCVFASVCVRERMAITEQIFSLVILSPSLLASPCVMCVCSFTWTCMFMPLCVCVCMCKSFISCMCVWEEHWGQLSYIPVDSLHDNEMLGSRFYLTHTHTYTLPTPHTHSDKAALSFPSFLICISSSSLVPSILPMFPFSLVFFRLCFYHFCLGA